MALASERNSLVVGSNPIQADYMYIIHMHKLIGNKVELAHQLSVTLFKFFSEKWYSSFHADRKVQFEGTKKSLK